METSPGRPLALPAQPAGEQRADTAAQPGTHTSARQPAGRRGMQAAVRGLAAGRPLPAATWLGSFLLLSAILLVRNAYLFTTKIYEDQDFAANSIAVLQAKHFQLLTGNYSKEGFYHPGPAFLYVMAAGESFFHDLLHAVPTPWNGQLLAILLLNAALIGAALSVLARSARSGRIVLAGLAVALLACAVHPLTVNSAWFPYVYFAPALLLLVSAASVASGQTADLPFLALSAWLCINGQAEFLLFAPVIVVVSLIALISTRWRHRGTAARIPSWHWILALATSAVLAFPIALNVGLHWPQPFSTYLSYTRAVSGQFTHHSALFTIEYVLRFWWLGTPASAADTAGLVILVVLCTLATALTLRCPEPGLRRFLLWSLAVCGLMTVMFFGYAFKAVDDNDISQTYLGYFYWAVPLQVALVAAAGLAAIPQRQRAVALSMAAAVAAATVIAAVVPQYQDNPDDPAAKYLGDPQIPPALQKITAAAHGREIVLNIYQNDWIDTVGLFTYAKRTGVPACAATVPGSVVYLMFRSQSSCTASEKRTGAQFWVLPKASLPATPAALKQDEVIAGLPHSWIARRV